MTRKTKWFGVLGLSTALAGAGYAGATDGFAQEDGASPAPLSTGERPVRTAVVTGAPDAEAGTMRFFGVTEAAREAVLSFTVGGRIDQRGVDVGADVRAGQVVARLDASGYVNNASALGSQLDRALAQADLADRDHARVAALFAEGAVSRAELDAARAGKDANKAAVAALQAQRLEAARSVGEATLNAPFDGQVVELFLEPGEFAHPGAPVARLIGDGEVQLLVEVPESAARTLVAGQTVQVELTQASSEARMSGTVASVGRAAPTRGRLYPIRVALPPNAALKPGMSAELLLTSGTSDMLWAPIEAVRDPTGHRPAVFRIEGETSRVERVDVEIARVTNDGRVGLRPRNAQALSVGDALVVDGHTYLLDGDAVSVIGKEGT